MGLITKRKIDATIEKRIVIGLATSKSFIQNIYSHYKPDYFLNSLTRTASKWFIDYYETYEEAPLKQVQNILDTHRKEMNLEEMEMMEKFLQEVSDLYEASGEVNVPYLTDITLKNFKRQEIQSTIDSVSYLLDREDVDKAEAELLNMKKISKITSNWVNPLSDEMVYKSFEEDKDVFLKMPGQLGDFLGNVKRGWLVGISGPFKKGKTFFALDMAIIAMLSNLRVAVISLEMSPEQMTSRVIKRLVPSSENVETMMIPVFDCAKNQRGDCTRPEREGRHSLLVNGNKPAFTPDLRYEVCTYCKNHPNHFAEFEQNTWFEQKKCLSFDYPSVASEIEGLNKRFKNKFRFKSFPKFTANSTDIETALDILEQTENFIPDVLVVDYVDILRGEDKATGVEKEDKSWMALGKLAQSRKMTVITPTQVNKEGLDATSLKLKHTARWVGKLGHVEMMISLNQTEEEKQQGIMRIGLLTHRFKKFNEGEEVILLQNIEFGQTHLDSFLK